MKEIAIERVTLEQFNELAREIHGACFHEDRDPRMNTFDYALLVRDEKKLIAYATLIELDRESVYMQHGGAFPDFQGSIYAVRAYKFIINYLRERYLRASTKIENINLPMLKMAMGEGFRITGAELFKGHTFAILGNEFYNELS